MAAPNMNGRLHLTGVHQNLQLFKEGILGRKNIMRLEVNS